MSVILHLSDLHLLGHQEEQEDVLDALVDAVAMDRRTREREVDLIAITGDLFDSASLDPEDAVAAFDRLHSRLQAALGAKVPTVVVPGNHDRRVEGLVGPHREGLFAALDAHTDDDVFVHGAGTPFLSAVVPHAFHGQPFWLIAYDSTYLPRGLLSAGGMIRQEDLLHAAAQINGHHPEWPVVFLLHHHLVSTPITDFDPIETKGRPRLFRWGVQELLPRLVANADREEWMMTALGAGTALSTLHSLGRAVLVLHGHKHNATARVLDATLEQQGDVVITSAGSAGTAQTVKQTASRRAARIWPSFNVVELDEDALGVEAVSFGWKGRSRGEIETWPLVWAARRGSQWKVTPMSVTPPKGGPRLLCNEARFELHPSRREGRWDLGCRRRIEPDLDARLPHYVETITAPRGARLEVLKGARQIATTPHELSLDPFETVRYHVLGGVFRSWSEAREHGGDHVSPYGAVELFNRYTSQRTRLVLEAPEGVLEGAFASATDVGNGLERPVHVERVPGRALVHVDACPARTLLRIYWPLEGIAAPAALEVESSQHEPRPVPRERPEP